MHYPVSILTSTYIDVILRLLLTSVFYCLLWGKLQPFRATMGQGEMEATDNVYEKCQRECFLTCREFNLEFHRLVALSFQTWHFIWLKIPEECINGSRCCGKSGLNIHRGHSLRFIWAFFCFILLFVTFLVFRNYEF